MCVCVCEKGGQEEGREREPITRIPIEMGSDQEELVRLFQKASKAADSASDIGGETEESRCVEALKLMHALPVTTSMLVSTQVFASHKTTVSLSFFRLFLIFVFCSRIFFSVVLSLSVPP